MEVTLTYRQIEQISKIIENIFATQNPDDGTVTVNQVNGLTGIRLRKIGRQLAEQFQEFDKDKKDIFDSYFQTDEQGQYIPKKKGAKVQKLEDAKLIKGKKMDEVLGQIEELYNKEIGMKLDRYLVDKDYEGLDLNFVEIDLLDLVSK